MTPRIALTLGEPAGIGPDIAVRLAQQPIPCRLAIIGDSVLLLDRAKQLSLPVTVDTWQQQTSTPKRLSVVAEKLQGPVKSGELNPVNVGYVLRCLDRAIDGCVSGDFDAMVTGPIHKGVINDAGIDFTGHTEYISKRTGSDLPVMMLVTSKLRVALVTTHVPLSKVSSLITRDRIDKVVHILIDALQTKFGINTPRIAVCGLNPHAGEQGHLGREEIEIITPVIKRYQKRGHSICGPLPADTVFIAQSMSRYDAVVTMYHDQGLPVIKHQGFDEAVNITLGVPIIRTSVDHGTALELAGTNNIDVGSSLAAIKLAIDLVKQQSKLH